VLLRQFQETCDYRRWLLLSAAVMQTHFHAVISVEGDPDPEILLRDLKSYGSRALNRDAGTPSGTDWWTESGSKRKLPNLEAVLAGVRYVQQQPGALVIHTANFPEFEEFNGERGASAP
jgi:REP element-mobilizing transposase RayT